SSGLALTVTRPTASLLLPLYGESAGRGVLDRTKAATCPQLHSRAESQKRTAVAVAVAVLNRESLDEEATITISIGPSPTWLYRIALRRSVFPIPPFASPRDECAELHSRGPRVLDRTACSISTGDSSDDGRA